MSPELFARIVALTGLSPLLARGTVRRALAAAGIDEPMQAPPRDYDVAMSQLTRRLAIYLPADEAAKRERAIRDALRGGAAPTR